MKKMLKGFTLVELIVVIAIIGVLAAILVPSMMGWIAKANMRTANTGAKEIYTNASAVIADANDTTYEAALLAAAASAAPITPTNGAGISLGPNGETFNSEMAKKMADNKGADWAVIIETSGTDATDVGTVIGTGFAKSSSNTQYIGCYPEDPDNKKGHFASTSEAAVAALAIYQADDASAGN